jgi:tRNA-specific 2-thiouridylase
MRVLVAMSGGVDSSVAAALLLEEGYDVVGVTLKLWGGAQDSGCCSVGDVEDARRVAQQLGIVHHVFNFTDDFEQHVVAPYVADHAAGRTPNPCVECNRHLKFDRLLTRASQLGFDVVATGHHARAAGPDGGRRLRRAVDSRKDQSYVLYMLGQGQLSRLMFPVGDLTKTEVRARAAALGLRTATKPESQDTCFVMSGGRASFLADRIPLRPGRIVDVTGSEVGTVPAVELVTVGQRKGLGGGSASKRYAIAVDPHAATVTIGTAAELRTDRVVLDETSWVSVAPGVGQAVTIQTSAHGSASAGTWDGTAAWFDRPQRRPAPGQAVVLYRGDDVLGGGTAAAS